MKKTIQNIVAINVNAWYENQDTQTKLKFFPLKLQWRIHKNIKPMEEIAKDFQKLKSELEQERINEWFTEGNKKCEKKIQEDGSEVLQIKDECLKEFREYENKLNTQLEEVVQEEVDIEFTPISLEEIIEISDETHAGIDMDDLDILSIFEEE